jgi:predicted nucleotidyltransferase
MSNSALIGAQLEKIITLLVERCAATVIYLFGSAVRAELKPDSDIDLAFLGDENIDNYEVFMVAQELAEVLGREVDLIDLRKASTVMKIQIVCKGRVLYEKDGNRRIRFEITALKDYTLLNEERRIILDNFLSGS